MEDGSEGKSGNITSERRKPTGGKCSIRHSNTRHINARQTTQVNAHVFDRLHTTTPSRECRVRLYKTMLS